MFYKIILKTSINNIHRVENCVQTWLRDQDYICLTDQLSGKYPEISGSNRTDYYSAEEKTVYLLNLVKNTDIFDKYDWLVFIDDDAILNIRKFLTIIHLMDKNTVYGLPIMSYPKCPQLKYPSGGAGYFISPNLIKKTKYIENNDWGIEDASVGKWIEQNNIALKHMPNDVQLNGWFPFPDHWHNLCVYGNSYAADMVSNFNETDNKTILKYLTNHYIRWLPLMQHVHLLYSNE